MAVDATKVLVGTPDQLTTGAISSGILGTTLPTDAVTALDAAFADSGYVSSDGVKLTQDMSTSDINDWSGALVRRVLEKFSGSISWSYIQASAQEWKNSFGEDYVTVTPATTEHGEQIAIRIGSRLPPAKSWVFNMKDGLTRIRIVCPNAQVTSRDDMQFDATDPISLPITLSCYPDGQGNSIYIYVDDGLVAAA